MAIVFVEIIMRGQTTKDQMLPFLFKAKEDFVEIIELIEQEIRQEFGRSWDSMFDQYVKSGYNIKVIESEEKRKLASILRPRMY